MEGSDGRARAEGWKGWKERSAEGELLDHRIHPEAPGFTPTRMKHVWSGGGGWFNMASGILYTIQSGSLRKALFGLKRQAKMVFFRHAVGESNLSTSRSGCSVARLRPATGRFHLGGARLGNSQQRLKKPMDPIPVEFPGYPRVTVP